MTQAGVPPDHAERALDHVIAGVRGVCHDYHAEKRAAFEALAARLDMILNPRPNVVPQPGGLIPQAPPCAGRRGKWKATPRRHALAPTRGTQTRGRPD
jgi:hypothetical protein